MAVLAANEGRVFEQEPNPIYNDLPVDAAVEIFEGSALGENASTGNARPLVNGDTFLGFAANGVDNLSGSAGDKVVRVRQRGIVKLDVTTVAGAADLGAAVNATDDNTFLLGAGTSLGKVNRHVTGSIAMVYFEAGVIRSI